MENKIMLPDMFYNYNNIAPRKKINKSFQQKKRIFLQENFPGVRLPGVVFYRPASSAKESGRNDFRSRSCNAVLILRYFQRTKPKSQGR